MRFDDIVTLENIYHAWVDFSHAKMKKQDIQLFGVNLEDELMSINHDLSTDRYVHGTYSRFIVHDPKRRIIHKATVRDRVVHRLVYNVLIPVFHRRWLDCSFSCRPSFGQHRSIETASKFLRQATKSWSDTCWILKCDIRKFFDSVDQHILLDLLTRHVYDQRVLDLLETIVYSFSLTVGRGLPIGNLTSQLFANVYMHELDWYVKQTLKHRWYVRYADDFLFLCQTQEEARVLLEQVQIFLVRQLKLNLHPNKITLRKSSWGIDWLGHVLRPSYEILRRSTHRRMMRKIEKQVLVGDGHRVRVSLASYHGLLLGTARRTIDEDLLQWLAFVRESDTIALVG